MAIKRKANYGLDSERRLWLFSTLHEYRGCYSSKVWCFSLIWRQS